MKIIIALLFLLGSLNVNASGWSTYSETIVEASWYVGVNPVTMAVFGHRESNFRNIDNRMGSGAAGLYQFKPTTWAYMLDRYKDEFELSEDASPYCAWTNSVLAAAYLRENEERLRGILRRDPTPAEIYMAHLLGPTGASRVLRADLNSKVTDIVPYAVNGNRRLLVRSNGAPRTVSQFRDYMNWEFDKLYTQYKSRVHDTITALDIRSTEMIDYRYLLTTGGKVDWFELKDLSRAINDHSWLAEYLFPVLRNRVDISHLIQES